MAVSLSCCAAVADYCLLWQCYCSWASSAAASAAAAAAAAAAASALFWVVERSSYFQSLTFAWCCVCACVRVYVRVYGRAYGRVYGRVYGRWWRQELTAGEDVDMKHVQDQLIYELKERMIATVSREKQGDLGSTVSVVGGGID